ncbi:MAG: hypothetical protein V4793_10360 [Paraburkholderia tropica]
MQQQLSVRAAAMTAVAMTILPGSAFALSTSSGPSFLPTIIHGDIFARDIASPQEALSLIGDPFSRGTHVNAQVVAGDPEDYYLGEMLRVAHALATGSSDIDADIARMVDEEFWDLI